MPITASELVLKLQEAYPDPLAATPKQMLVLIEALQNETDAIRGRLEVRMVLTVDPVQGQLNVQMKKDLDRWETLLDYYRGATVSAADDGIAPVDEAGLSLFYKQVVAPLIDGQCYFAPSCSETILEQKGVPFAIMPRAATPFLVEAEFQASEKASRENFERFVEDLKKEIAEAFSLVVDFTTENVLGPFFWGLGAVAGLAGLVWLAGRPKRAA